MNFPYIGIEPDMQTSLYLKIASQYWLAMSVLFLKESIDSQVNAE